MKPKISSIKILKIAICYVTILLIGYIDYKLGFEISFSLFYLVPVGYIAYTVSKVHGLIIAIFASFVWGYANYISGFNYSHFMIPYWNTLVRLIFFISASLLFSLLKSHLIAEKILAGNDHLTGIANSRSFFNYADRMLLHAKKYKYNLTIIYIDLDNFKQVNDTQGHLVGDLLLKNVANVIKQSIRQTDLAARIGGDEFAVIIPGIDEQRSEEITSILQKSLLAKMKEHSWPVTFSIGLAIFIDFHLSLEEMIKEADQLMYVVKKGSKNAYIKKIIT